MTIKELFSSACKETGFKVTVHDTHYHYLENYEGDSVLYVDFSNDPVYEVDCKILQSVEEYHIVEWWITITSGILHIMVEEDLPENCI